MYHVGLVVMLVVGTFAAWAHAEPPDKPKSASQPADVHGGDDEMLVLWEFDTGG